MSSSEAPYQANFKTPKGSLLNIRAWSEAELDQALDALLTRVNVINDVELAIDAVCNLQQGGIKVTQTTVTNTPPAAPAPMQGYTPPAVTPANAPTCEHGEAMRYVPAGISKAGKPYKGFYACARPRTEACNSKA